MSFESSCKMKSSNRSVFRRWSARRPSPVAFGVGRCRRIVFISISALGNWPAAESGNVRQADWRMALDCSSVVAARVWFCFSVRWREQHQESVPENEMLVEKEKRSSTNQCDSDLWKKMSSLSIFSQIASFYLYSFDSYIWRWAFPLMFFLMYTKSLHGLSLVFLFRRRVDGCLTYL